MNKSSKFSLLGLFVCCICLGGMDFYADSVTDYNYNRLLFVGLVVGICLTVVGGYLTKYDLDEIPQNQSKELHSFSNGGIK